MIGHYLAIALRNAWRHKGTTLSKVVALSLGLACFIGAYTVADYFNQFDTHWANAGRIYAISEKYFPPGSSVGLGLSGVMFVSAPVAKYLRADFPQLAAVARQMSSGRTPVVAGGKKTSRNIDGADADFLKIFNLPFVAGDPKHALSRPKSAIVTAKAAEGMFGTTDVLGRTIRLGKSEDVTITGVISKIRPPSHFGKSLFNDPFDLLVSMDVIDDLFKAAYPAPKGAKAVAMSQIDSWQNLLFPTYVLLPKDGSVTRADLDRGLKGFGARHIAKNQGTASFKTAPMTEFTTSFIDQIFLGGRFGIPFTVILYILGVLVLGVACLDFANLATAEAAARAKEIGMRKALGATRRQIFVQSLIEAGLLSLLSLAIALVAVFTAIAHLNQPDIGLYIPGLDRRWFWAGIAGILIAVTLAAGGYPAMILARVRPIFALRPGALHGGSRLLRALLIGSQFAATSFLVIAVMVIYVQNATLRRTGLNRTTDPDLSIRNSLLNAQINPKTFRSEILALPGVKGYTAADIAPYGIVAGTMMFSASPDPSAKLLTFNPRGVSYDFFKVTGVKLLAGRGFSEVRDDAADDDSAAAKSVQPKSIIIDRSAAAAFGWTPDEAVGKTIYDRSAPRTPDGKAAAVPRTIIGVADNQPLQLTTVGPPSIAYFLNVRTPYPIIQISRGDVSGTVKRIDAVWRKLAPDTPIKHRFMDEAFQAAYSMYTTISKASAIIALFAIVISVMGLIGMATYMVGRRLHEVGVRKTLGASSRQVLWLLLWDLSKPVLIANVIAWPFAYIAAEQYLDLFVSRADLSVWPFLASLGVTLTVAWGAVGAQAIRAARVNPARVLRYE